MQSDIKKILIIRLSAIGDAIHTLPLACAIKKQYPNVQLDWVVEDKAKDFIVDNPIINNVYVLERKKWKQNSVEGIKKFTKIIKKIRNEKYDIAIDTQQLLKSATILGLSGAKRKIALDKGREFSGFFANEIIQTQRPQFDINYHVVNRTLEIAQYLGCKTDFIEFRIPSFENEISKNVIDVIDNLDKSKKTIVIAPATTWDNKHWTIEGFKDIINEFKDSYNIIITASPKEKPLTDKILENIESTNIINLSGVTTLKDLSYIFKHVDLLISPDSGSAHIAWASGCKSIITLFFATSAKRTAPFGENYYSVSTECNCAPCMKKHCKNKSNICIQNISSKKVTNLVEKVLQNTKKGYII